PPTPTITVSPTPTPTLAPKPVVSATFGDWTLSLLIILISAVAVYWLGVLIASVRWGLRWGLLAVFGGFVAYNYLALKLPGSQGWLESYGTVGVLAVTFLGVLAGLLAGWLWHWLSNRYQKTSAPRKTSNARGL
ncbi:MAG TPA: hypothetical protein VIO61_01045, partial [Anaerolineaceae bacterium]